MINNNVDFLRNQIFEIHKNDENNYTLNENIDAIIKDIDKVNVRISELNQEATNINNEKNEIDEEMKKFTIGNDFLDLYIQQAKKALSIYLQHSEHDDLKPSVPYTESRLYKKVNALLEWDGLWGKVSNRKLLVTSLMNNIDKNKFNSEDWLEFNALLDKIDSFRKMILCEEDEDEDEDFFPTPESFIKDAENKKYSYDPKLYAFIVDPTKLSSDNERFYKPTAYDPKINTYETPDFTLKDYFEYKQEEGKKQLKTADDYIATSIFNHYESICVKKELLEQKNEIKKLESFIEIEKLNINLNNLKQQEEELRTLEEINEKIEELKQHESLSQLEKLNERLKKLKHPIKANETTPIIGVQDKFKESEKKKYKVDF